MDDRRYSERFFLIYAAVARNRIGNSPHLIVNYLAECTQRQFKLYTGFVQFRRMSL